jgi:hypothetical protein
MSVDDALAKKSAVADQLLKSLVGDAPLSGSKRTHRPSYADEDVQQDDQHLAWGKPQQQHVNDRFDYDDDDDQFAPTQLFSSQSHRKPAPAAKNASPKRPRHNAAASSEEKCCIRVIGVPVRTFVEDLLNQFSQYGDIVRYTEAGNSALHIQYSTSRSAEAAVMDTAATNTRIGGHEMTAHRIPRLDYQDPERRSSYYKAPEDLPYNIRARRLNKASRQHPAEVNTGYSSNSLLMANLRDNFANASTVFNRVLVFAFGNDPSK